MAEFDLRALQMQVEAENSVEASREVLTEAVEFFSGHKDNQWKVDLVMKDMRDNLDLSSIDEKGIFLYDSDEFNFMDIPEQYKGYTLGLFSNDKYSRYAGRLVYPVRDVKGKVMGLCGWDPTELPKYLDSNTFGYNAKNNCLYGMEKLPEYYVSKENVYIVEGITCCNYLRSKGLQALALLGSSISKYVVEILRRFGYRCILLPDNDKAGLSILKSAEWNLDEARCYVSTVAKDMDDTRKIEDGKYEDILLSELRSLNNPFVLTKVLRIIK